MDGQVVAPGDSGARNGARCSGGQAKPCPFRSIGFTAAAAQYPLGADGLEIIAEHNGVTVDRLPFAARFSSGPGMHDWMTRLGSRKAAGLPYRHPSGRFLLPSEIRA